MLDTPKKAAVPAANNGPARARPPQPPAPPAKSDAAKPAAPAPEPTAPEPTVPETDPTRYGDWEKKGRCIDF
jgi:hypothetical protein